MVVMLPYTELAAKWVGREQQIRELMVYLDPKSCATSPIFVTGPSGTGKTNVVWCGLTHLMS